MSGRHIASAVLLLFPSLMTAQNVSIDLVTGHYPGPYYPIIDPSGIGPGDRFILWSIIHTDIPLDGIEYRLHVNGDAENDKFDLVGYAPGALSGHESFLGLPLGRLDGYGDAFSFDGPPTGFGFLDYDKKAPAGLDTIAGSESIFNFSGTVDDLDGKTLIGYIIEANSNYTPGVYEISALGRIGGGPMAEWTSTPQTGQITTGQSLIFVPEPATALLLLTAVPLLRRRGNAVRRQL